MPDEAGHELQQRTCGHPAAYGNPCRWCATDTQALLAERDKLAAELAATREEAERLHGVDLANRAFLEWKQETRAKLAAKDAELAAVRESASINLKNAQTILGFKQCSDDWAAKREEELQAELAAALAERQEAARKHLHFLAAWETMEADLRTELAAARERIAALENALRTTRIFAADSKCNCISDTSGNETTRAEMLKMGREALNSPLYPEKPPA